MTKHIPNFITSLNLASGFIAIILTSRGDIEAASWLIVAAMVFDFLDGFAARLLKAGSDIGKELDSLADIVSFGVAPAFILYNLFEPLFLAEPSVTVSVLKYSPVIMAVFAAVRLAVFNTDPGQYAEFKGLPTPANAFAVIALVLSASYGENSVATSLSGNWPALLTYTIVLSLLMVSRIPLMSFKISGTGLRGNEARLIFIAAVLILVGVAGFGALVYIIPVYIIISLVSTLVITPGRK